MNIDTNTNINTIKTIDINIHVDVKKYKDIYIYIHGNIRIDITMNRRTPVTQKLSLWSLFFSRTFFLLSEVGVCAFKLTLGLGHGHLLYLAGYRDGFSRVGLVEFFFPKV